MKKSLPCRYARQRLVMLAARLIGYCGLACEQAATAEDNAPKSKVEQGAARDQPSPPAGPLATIGGVRQARFGMSEEQVRQVIHKDFPASAAKISGAIHPSEKTTVSSLTAADLLPNTGTAHISYIFGYRSKRLIQVNIVWSSDGRTAGDESVVGTANSLRDYFTSENFQSRQRCHQSLTFRERDPGVSR
jgi:hypothetical protein